MLLSPRHRPGPAASHTVPAVRHITGRSVINTHPPPWRVATTQGRCHTGPVFGGPRTTQGPLAASTAQADHRTQTDHTDTRSTRAKRHDFPRLGAARATNVLTLHCASRSPHSDGPPTHAARAPNGTTSLGWAQPRANTLHCASRPPHSDGPPTHAARAPKGTTSPGWAQPRATIVSLHCASRSPHADGPTDSRNTRARSSGDITLAAAPVTSPRFSAAAMPTPRATARAHVDLPCRRLRYRPRCRRASTMLVLSRTRYRLAPGAERARSLRALPTPSRITSLLASTTPLHRATARDRANLPRRRRRCRSRYRRASPMLALSRARRRLPPRAERARLLRASLPPQ